jgi:adenine-specific DNA-methyltransferase
MKYNTKIKTKNHCETTSKHKTIPYMGSKRTLLNFIDLSLHDFLENVVKDNTCNSFFDAFSGSGQVANHFKNTFKIITNDKQSFTKVINDTYLCSNADKNKVSDLIQTLNSIPGFYFDETDGWFTKHYSKDFDGGSAIDKDGTRKVWLTKNGKRIDNIRTLIESWFNQEKINTDEKNVLLLSLMLAVSKVSNDVGHHNGYLKSWDKKSCDDLVLVLPAFDTNHCFEHENYCGDIFDTLAKVQSDITYFDPPYGTNNEKVSCSVRYSSFYHLWNTIAENSRPDVFGKASKPLSTKGYTEPLEKNNKEAVMPKFIRLIEESTTKYVCFSYSNKSLLTADDFEEVYRLAGCDMSTFRIYHTSHKSNNQTKLALKSGDFIHRENHNDALLEFFIIAKKKPFHKRISDKKLGKGLEKIPTIDEWVKANTSSYSITDKKYGIVFDKETKSFLKDLNKDHRSKKESISIYNDDVLTAAGRCITIERKIMKNKTKELLDIKNIELWALTETIDNWFIENTIEKNDIELVEMAIRDLGATYPLNIFRILPSYSRLLVIKMLDYFEVLSVDNIHYVENELRNDPDSYCNHDGHLEVIARKIRQEEKTYV